MDESRLVAQLKQKRRRALHIAIETYTGYVSAIVRRTLGQAAGREDMEEVVSDVFLALWNHAEELDPSYGLRPWLATLSRNKAIDRLRRLCPSQPIPDDAATSDPGPEELAQRQEESSALRQAVEALPEPDRTLFLRYYYADEPLKAVARDLGLKESNAKTRLARGRNKLKEQLLKGGLAYERKHP